MRVALVAMPWQALDSPSLPIGLLKAVCAKAGYPEVFTYHGSIHWAEHLLEQSSGDITPEHYSSIAENGVFDGIGEWVFAGALYPDWSGNVGCFEAYVHEKDIDATLPRQMRKHASTFVELAASRILASKPSLVGFTTTFMQNVPSLAVAARVKQRAPHTHIVFGGGNCDGPMGEALHRAFDFIDFVVRGEGEEALPSLLELVKNRASFESVPGLCWRGSDGATVANPMSAAMVPPHNIPIPDFDDWFEALEASVVRQYVEPQLVLESARGCWWGELHHCTFCGLNGSMMKFRGKEPAAFIEELSILVRRHQILDVMMVDNIIDNSYFTSVLPALRDLDWDLRLHYEVKSNLRSSQIDALRSAGVINVQPGIESLVTSVLKIMDKGVSATHNTRTLRDCESAGLTVSWNWLVGFPGEADENYAEVLQQLPALVHLQPPIDAFRIVLERFSPYFQRPDLGFRERKPAKFYRHVYDLPEDILDDLVYMFDTEPRGLSSDTLEELRSAISLWRGSYQQSSLVRRFDQSAIRIMDRRRGWPAKDYHITEPRFVAAYKLLEDGHSATGLTRRLQDNGLVIDPDELSEWLATLHAAGLTFVEGGRHVALPTAELWTKLS